MGKTLLEFQSTKGDVLPAHKVKILLLKSFVCYLFGSFTITFMHTLHLLVLSEMKFLYITQMGKKIY